MPAVARAEYHRLASVRVHEPGLEAWSGALDPDSNLFDRPVAVDRARAQHRRYVDVLEANGVTVHTLAGDLAAGGVLDDLVREYTAIDAGDLDAALRELAPAEKLQLLLSRARTSGESDAPASLHVERPISNVFFQRDTTIVGDRGPILASMYSPVRRPETPLVEAAWDAIDEPVIHEASAGPIEGGEFIPMGELALLGVSGVVDGEEVVVRTSYDAGRELLDEGALGYDEVGLVRAPIETERRLRADHDGPSRMMHLLGWFNVAAEGLAVTFPEMARAATVDLYERRGDGYERTDTTDLLSLLEDRGYDVVAADWGERWPTNFVAIDDADVVALFDPDEGAYRPEHNPTIEALKARGVTVRPDGEGLPTGPLTNGAGGVHCMTTPIERRS